jgi:streptomycin 6-kinase
MEPIVEVTQADREAMIAYECARPVGLSYVFREAVRDGHHDDDSRVQAFARHRLTSPYGGELGYPTPTPELTPEAHHATLAAENTKLRGLLAECAADLRSEIVDRWCYDDGKLHPALQHKFYRDIAPVLAAEALLQAAEPRP